MTLFDHPGFMWYGAGAGGPILEVLHADWPSYPPGHGWQIALKALGVFPVAAHFREISDIDQCRLFVVTGLGAEPSRDMFSPQWFHVAAWNEDLLELHDRGLITGAITVSAYDDALRVHEESKRLCVQTPNGLQPLDLPAPSEDEFEEDAQRVLRVSASGLRMTAPAAAHLEQLARPFEDLHPRIVARLGPLLEVPLRDTAVRDAAVMLESRLREITGSDQYGQALVDLYWERLCAYRAGTASAFFKVLRGELRTVFKFIRNDFAHRLRELSAAQCAVLLDRISAALEAVDHVETVEAAPRQP